MAQYAQPVDERRMRARRALAPSAPATIETAQTNAQLVPSHPHDTYNRVQRAQQQNLDPANIVLPAQIQTLQRTVGNRAAAQLLQSGQHAIASAAPVTIQRTLADSVIQRSPFGGVGNWFKNKAKSAKATLGKTARGISQHSGLTAAVSWSKTNRDERAQAVDAMSNDPFQIEGLDSLFGARVDLLPYLIDFAQTELSQENVKCMAAVIRFERGARTFTQAQNIFNQYVDRGSPEEVNIPNTTHAAIEQILNLGPVHFANHSDTIFAKLHTDLIFNISDTWARMSHDEDIGKKLRVRTPIGRIMDAIAGKKLIDTGTIPAKRRTALQYLNPNMEY